MNPTRQALIFGGIIIAILLLVVGINWFVSLFSAPAETEQNPVEDFFSSIFPFGGETRVPPSGEPNPEDQIGTGPTSAFHQVSMGPVAGVRFQTNGILRYVERETGHFREALPGFSGTTRISNTTIPGVRDIVWLSDSQFVLQYAGDNDETRHFLATLASSTPDQALLGSFITGVSDIAAGSDTASMIKITKTSGTVATRQNKNGIGESTLFSSPLRGWRFLPTDTVTFLETVPSSVAGYLYRLRDGQPPEKIIGGVAGLMALPHPSGKFIAYSFLSGGRTVLSVLDIEQNKTYTAPVATLAEKCAWFSDAKPTLFCGVPAVPRTIPIEEWYAGRVTSADAAWVVDPISGTATLVNEIQSTAAGLDVMNPVVSKDGAYAAFLDKNNLSLWILKLAK